MHNNSVRLILIFGSLAICGVLLFQSYWLIETWTIKNQTFDTQVMKSLRQVAVKIADVNETELPKSNLIQKISGSYAVNVNSAIDANILEDFLVRTFDEASLNTVFEYAVYDCANDQLAYHNLCNLTAGQENFERSENLPKFNDLIYYFVVSFPKRDSYLINDLRSNILFSLITILAVMMFMYALWVILKQQKLTDLQKDFINNMTHEFKTPISSIKIASDYIIGEIREGNERLQKYASIIKEQNERLNNQVEKVLNIARLEKDQFKLNLEVIELVDFVDRLVRTEKIKFDEKSGELKFDSCMQSIHIKADKLHLSNVLSNIIDNAFKYCKKTPYVTVSLEKNDNSKLILAVRDKGIGIKKENLRKIFDKFYRVSTGNVHDVKGFGLGLYYVKNISDAHGWEIDIDSTTNEGTEVQIQIPILK
ncbi:MAG: sensor histidine kinase [Saprospiraceae bacterium]|jgi:two-component system phosphate regulon sensor histidine kinase PhoR